MAGEDTLTPVFSCESEAVGRDREDQPDYKVRMSAAFCFSNKVQLLEYYHNSSWLEHGGSPEHAVRTAFVYQINKYLKEKNLYKKGESAISFQDVQDCLGCMCPPAFPPHQPSRGRPRPSPINLSRRL